ncbi:MAG: DsbC family protein [Gammaproteobacteria bacterium]|nr:DsbC family protein [Gammaproteobacteria bacterium]
MNITTLGRMAKTITLVCCAGFSSLMHAAEAPEWEQGLRDAINNSLGAVTQGQLRVEQVRETPMPGLYELIMSSGEILLSDRTGQFLISGELYQTQAQGLVNLTAQTRQVQVKDLIAGMPEEQMIIFSPENPVATITVFTDVDCTYCRRLHHDIEAINERGIAVRYMAYPRGGLDSTALPKMISVWCAPDRQRALTQAKNGQNLPERDCQNPVLNHHALGNRIGITGTPAIILPNGQLVPGYVEVDRLSALVFGQ